MYKPSFKNNTWYVVEDRGSLVVVICKIGTGNGCRQLAIERARSLNKSDIARIIRPIELETLIKLSDHNMWFDGLEEHNVVTLTLSVIEDYLMNTKLMDMDMDHIVHSFELFLDSQFELVSSDLARAEREGHAVLQIDLLLHRIHDLIEKVSDLNDDYEGVGQ
tara:strand:- start:120 stop:608 length:489 start_codon:yes stop_codon:yes gene_type:complete